MDDFYSTEFLNNIKMSEISNHEIKLKVRVSIMLLRNIDKSLGLCNGNGLLVTRLGKHFIEANIIFEGNIGEIVFIPQLTVTLFESQILFKLTRRQFPITCCFSITINESQDQFLSNVGIYLSTLIFFPWSIVYNYF